MATGATEFIDLTTADVYLMELWSKEVTVAREQKLVFAQNVNRRFEAQLKKGQILRIGNISHLAARAKTINTAITFETITETEATITINTYYYAAFALEDVIEPMVSVDLVSKYTPELGYALALQVDDDVAALIDDGTITQEVGTLATELTYDNLVRADQYLNDANVPQDGRVLIFSPAQRAACLKLDQFIHGDYSKVTGESSDPVGRWWQYPIFITSNVDGSNAAGHDNVMMHKDCIALIQQRQPVVRTFWDINYFCGKVAALETYGMSIIRADHGVWLKGA